MKTNTDYKPAQSFGLLLVGDQKTGKSRVALAFPDPYILDMDRNLSSAVNVEPNKKFWFEDPYTTDDGKPVADKDVWKLNTDRLKVAARHPEIKTIVVDSLSTLSQALVYHIAAETSQMEGAKSMSDDILSAGANVRTGEKGIIGGLLRRQDYMIFQTMMIRLVTFLRSSNKNIIWTAHQKIREGDVATGANLMARKYFRINMPGSLADNFGAFYSDVWGTYAEPGPSGQRARYFLQTAPSLYHVDLGTSLKMDPRIEMTDKTPSQIWSLIGSKVQTEKKS